MPLPSPFRVGALVVFAAISPLVVNAQPPALNAASPAYGTHINYKASADAHKNREIGPEVLLDGNPHSSFIVTGVPYTVTIELPVKFNVEKISLTQSDIDAQCAPENIEVSFDGGEPLKKTLDTTKATKGKPAWQDIAVGKEIKSVSITVLSVTNGKVNFGGLGDVAVWTTDNIVEKLGGVSTTATAAATPAPKEKGRGKGKGKNKDAGDVPLIPPPGYDPDEPTFVHAITPTLDDGKVGKAVLPPMAAPGEHPRLLFTKKELADLQAKLNTTEKGKASLGVLMGLANGAIDKPVEFPSPEDTAANKPEAGKKHGSNSHAAQASGFAYALTGDEKYAKHTRDILVGYAERYESYPRHSGRNRADNSKITFQRLSEAMWLIPLLEGYDYIHDSKSLSDADKKLIDDKLVRAGIFEIRRLEPKQEAAKETQKNPDWRTFTPPASQQGKFPNWVNFYNTATMMAGSLLDDKDMVDLAAYGFREAVATGIGADGMWGEGAIGYQLFAMGVMCPGFETAAHLGIDLWDTSDGRFKLLFDSPLLYAYPDATMPGIGDSGRARLEGWQAMVYDYGYLRYHEARYASVVNAANQQLQASEGIYFPGLVYDQLDGPAVVKAGSVLFGSLGNAILRDDTKYSLLHYGPFVAPHSHYDKLNLIVFCSPQAGVPGDEMGGEPVFHRYEDPLHGEWTVQSVAHNTVTVDERSQTASTGKVLVYEDTPAVKLMRCDVATAYPGVMLDRTVLTTPTAIIDLYHGVSGLEHTWDRTLRFRGTMDGLPADVPADAKPLGETSGYQHIKVVKNQSATTNWTGTWTTKVGAFTAMVVGAPGQEVTMGFDPDKAGLAIVRQKGKEANFATVYAMPAWNNAVTSAAWLPDDPAANGAKIFEIKQQDGSVTRVIVAHKPGEWTAGGWKSDARVLYVCTKGDEMTVLLGGGKFAQNGDLTFNGAAEGNYLAKKEGGKLTAVSQWTPTPAQ